MSPAIRPDDHNPGPNAEEIAQRLLESENVCDRRKGLDLCGLIDASRGIWKGRFRIESFAGGPARSLAVICSIGNLRSLLWADEPRRHDRWRFVIGITHDYPLSRPEVSFLKPLPFNPHVVMASFTPQVDGLPPELQAYIRNGSMGSCCYLRSDHWRPTTDSLVTVVWLLSRLLAGQIHAEPFSLNKAARDHMLRMIRSGEVADLGPPLPCPVPAATGRRAATGGNEAGDADIVWTDVESEEVANHDA